MSEVAVDMKDRLTQPTDQDMAAVVQASQNWPPDCDVCGAKGEGHTWCHHDTWTHFLRLGCGTNLHICDKPECHEKEQEMARERIERNRKEAEANEIQMLATTDPSTLARIISRFYNDCCCDPKMAQWIKDHATPERAAEILDRKCDKCGGPLLPYRYKVLMHDGTRHEDKFWDEIPVLCGLDPEKEYDHCAEDAWNRWYGPLMWEHVLYQDMKSRIRNRTPTQKSIDSYRKQQLAAFEEKQGRPMNEDELAQFEKDLAKEVEGMRNEPENWKELNEKQLAVKRKNDEVTVMLPGETEGEFEHGQEVWNWETCELVCKFRRCNQVETVVSNHEDLEAQQEALKSRCQAEMLVDYPRRLVEARAATYERKTGTKPTAEELAAMEKDILDEEAEAQKHLDADDFEGDDIHRDVERSSAQSTVDRRYLYMDHPDWMQAYTAIQQKQRFSVYCSRQCVQDAQGQRTMFI